MAKPAPHFNSVTNYMSDPTLTTLLQDLVTTAAMPLHALERDFAADSSGFSSSRFVRWVDEKWGGAKERVVREWVKADIMVGTLTNVVTAIEVTDWKAADSPQFPQLVRSTAKDFDVAEVSADKAYLSKSNVELVEEVGATPFIPWKSNSKPTLDNASAWGRMYYRFMSDPDTYMARYHRRSNVETTFSMLKGKFGDSVMSKSTHPAW